MKRIKLLFRTGLTMALLLLAISGYSQDRFEALENHLDRMSAQVPGLNEEVNFSVNGASLQEFVRGLGSSHGLNLTVSPNIKAKLINKFTDAKVKDVLVFLCREYSLDMTFQGNIISFSPYVEVQEPESYTRKIPKVEYNQEKDWLSLDLRRDSIEFVIEEINRQSLKPIVVSPEAAGTVFRSVILRNYDFEKALEDMCYTENLKLVKTRSNAYRIEKMPDEKTNGGNGRPGQAAPKRVDFVYEVTDGRIDIEAHNTPVKDIIAELSRELHHSYFMFTEIEDNTTLLARDATFEDILNNIFNGTEHTYKKQDGVYLFGKRSEEGLRTTELIRLENRTVTAVMDFIPAELSTDVELKEFPELNGIIASGSYPKIVELENFIAEIDQVVPMVMVEVIIVDVNKSKFIKAGLTAGLGEGPSETTFSYNPLSSDQTGGATATVGAGTLNELINSFNGYGLINLGAVSPDFYLNISALESDQFINIRSTPRISTLNGHEANLKVGKTEYYAQTRFQTQGQLTTTTIQEQVWESNTADLAITIKPNVSSGEMITLDITVDQSDFVGTATPGAPRDQFTRSFQSLIRVHNGDMILLGGLEQKEGGNTSDGLPLIARIPVLKWIFGTNTKTKSKTELNVFIKPTVIY